LMAFWPTVLLKIEGRPLAIHLTAWEMQMTEFLMDQLQAWGKTRLILG